MAATSTIRHAAVLLCLLLAGCSWFSPEPEPEVIDQPKAIVAPTLPTLPPFGSSIGFTQEDIAKAVQQAKATIDLTDRSKDSAADRTAKLGALSDLSHVASLAVAIGFMAFLASAVFPIPGLKVNALITIGIGASISILAPWLNDIMGDDNARIIAYVAFGIVAISASVGLAWYIIDKVKDETEDHGQDRP